MEGKERMFSVRYFAAVLILLLSASPAFADVGRPPEYPNEAAEMVFIGCSTMMGLANTGAMIGNQPSYLMGGIGVASGAVTLALLTGDNPRYEKGLFAAGVYSTATGLITLWRRHELNKQSPHASLRPTWSGGSPGLALVLDF